MVLPLCLNFFITFNSSIPLPKDLVDSPKINNPRTCYDSTLLDRRPRECAEIGTIGSISLSTVSSFNLNDDIFTIPVNASSLLASTITLDDYINFVLMFMLVFAVAFQLPLVMLALVRIGIIEVSFLRKQRRLVYFIMAIVSAVISPGDVVMSMLALLIPLMFLYEFGIWLSIYSQRQAMRERAAEGLE